MPSEDECPICGQPIDVACKGYCEKPFLDGRRYEAICFCCSEVPLVWHRDEEAQMWRFRWDPTQLQELEDMIADGFDKKRSAICIKAVRASIKKHLR